MKGDPVSAERHYGSAARHYGLLAEFDTAAALLHALRLARERYTSIDVYSPCPVPGLDELLPDAAGGISGSVPASVIPASVLGGGLVGAGATFGLEWYSAVINYPINVGGRPTGSWIAFLPPALEMCLFGAAVCGVAAWLWSSRLPRLHHPVFDVTAFERATSDRFFLLVRACGEDFDMARARAFIVSLSPLTVSEVRQ